MSLVQLGEQVAMQLASFADAAKRRQMEPVCCIVGSRQFQALAAWSKEGTDITGALSLKINGLPVWRDERDYHLEIECLHDRDASQLEACLRA